MDIARHLYARRKFDIRSISKKYLYVERNVPSSCITDANRNQDDSLMLRRAYLRGDHTN